MPKPLVSVIIINWNHKRHLKECLDALLAQEYPDLEILLVDNASTDHSVDWVAENYPDIRLVAFTENCGFSPAFNYAVRMSGGTYILSLNPDVTIRPFFLEAMVDRMTSDKRIGIVAPKLLQTEDPTLLDSTGLFIDRSRRPYDRGQGSIDHQQFDLQTNVFGACGAAALYRRAMLEDVQLDGQFFDEDFFAYFEDADLAWRAQLMGWRAAYEPNAVALHVRGFGDTLRKRREKNDYGPRLALRNRYMMTLKNDDLISFLVDLPLILFSEIPRLMYMIFVSPVSLLGFFDLVRALPKVFRKRKQIKSGKRVGYSKVRRWFTAFNSR